jgi:polysaccharide pyruvyl transferase WcaK-like protein
MNVILLNDTSRKAHHGCGVVVSNIIKQVSQRNGVVVYCNRVGVNWQKNARFLKHLKSADLVIVNGEGTIHHSQKRGLDLVKIAKFAKENYSIPSVLINASFQDNSVEIVEYTRYFSLVYVRDGYSKRSLDEHGIASVVVPDLSFYTDYDLSNKVVTSSVAVTDSVFDKTAEMLCKFSRLNGYRFIPILSYPKVNAAAPVTTRMKRYRFYFLRALRLILVRLGVPLRYRSLRTLFYLDNYDDYIQAIASANFAIIGRYHALCFALKTLTPFIALKSNSHKMEAILNDVGIRGERIVEVCDNEEIIIEIKPFTDEEMERVSSYVKTARLKIEDMFDQVVSLVHTTGTNS